MDRCDWSDLPDLLLHSVSTRLRSLADFSAFAGVCSSWRRASAFSKPDFMSSHSPLVLCSATLSESSPVDVYNLYSLGDCRFYAAKLARPEPDRFPRCIGFSGGFLLMLDHLRRQPRLVNPLTAAELRFPATDGIPIDTAVLVSPRRGDRVLLALMSPNCAFQASRPGAARWSVCDARHWVWCAAAHRGKVYALVDDWRLAELDVGALSPGVSLVVGAEPLPEVALPQGGAALAEAGGELVAVVAAAEEKSVQVLRWEEDGRRWARTRSLRGGSVVVGPMLQSAYVGAWGGEGDCVYFTNFWRSSRSLLRVRVPTGEVEDVSVNEEEGGPPWDYCVWVLPSLCYS